MSLIKKEVSPNMYDIIETYQTVDIDGNNVTMGKTVKTGINIVDLRKEKEIKEAELASINSIISLIEEA